MTGTDYKKLLDDAITAFVFAVSDEEISRIIADNPILLEPRTLEKMYEISQRLQGNVTIVDDAPEFWASEHWAGRLKVLESYKNPPKVHESEV